MGCLTKIFGIVAVVQNLTVGFVHKMTLGPVHMTGLQWSSARMFKSLVPRTLTFTWPVVELTVWDSIMLVLAPVVWFSDTT